MTEMKVNLEELMYAVNEANEDTEAYFKKRAEVWQAMYGKYRRPGFTPKTQGIFSELVPQEHTRTYEQSYAKMKRSNQYVTYLADILGICETKLRNMARIVNKWHEKTNWAIRFPYRRENTERQIEKLLSKQT